VLRSQGVSAGSPAVGGSASIGGPQLEHAMSKHWVGTVYAAYQHAAAFRHEEALELWQHAHSMFPSSLWVQQQLAIARYEHMNDAAGAAEIFTAIFEEDPHR
jgi:hypothetical protein